MSLSENLEAFRDKFGAYAETGVEIGPEAANQFHVMFAIMAVQATQLEAILGDNVVLFPIDDTLISGIAETHSGGFSDGEPA